MCVVWVLEGYMYICVLSIPDIKLKKFKQNNLLND